MPTDYDGNAKKYGQDAAPEGEAEAEGEYEGEVEPLLLSIDKKIEVKKLMQAVTGAKANSWRQVEEEAAGVSLASIVRVRESCERKRPRPGVGYAVAALRSESGAA